MEEQKKKQNGITLIALVISIIVMLILAGVSLNMTIGDNGIVTKAQEAAVQAKIAQQKEEIEHALTNINIDTLSEDIMPEIDQIAKKLVSVGAIDDYQRAKDVNGNPTDNVAVIVDPTTRNRCFFGIKEDNKYKISRDTEGLVSAELVSEISGGSVEGLALVTKESFGEEDATGNDPNKGKFEITSNAEVMFLDPISGKLSIYVPSGVHAKVSIYAKMELTNAGIKRSAIDIAEGGELDLYVDDGVEVKVNSGVGEDAANDTSKAVGKPGYAGIHVPEGATLNLKGAGTIIAIGGKASAGGSYTGSNQGGGSTGGSGGGGAGAGIGGSGGLGATGVGRGTGNGGGNAENCGTVNVHDEIKVFAYGGKGASGGHGHSPATGGGGGYPAAGIGGGGAGGAGGTGCCAGGGGYTGGTPGYGNSDSLYATNGFSGYKVGSSHWYDAGWNGGGYFEGPSREYTTQKVVDASGNILSNFSMITVLGGIGNQGYNTDLTHKTSDGGKAGSGGTVSVSTTAKVYAYNGNRYTDGTPGPEEDVTSNQCPIYLQRGIQNARYSYTKGGQTGSSNNWKPILELKLESVAVNNASLQTTYENPAYKSLSVAQRSVTMEIGGTSTTIDMLKQGVGSGAGYIEVSNGSYTVYNEDSNSNFTTVYTGT